MSHDIWKMSCSILPLAVALLLTFVVTTCNKPAEPRPVITVEHEITPQPARVGLATLTLKLADANRQPVAGAAIKLEGNMSHPGMRPVFAEAREVEPGRYQAPLDFTMAGDWIILIQVTLAGGEKLGRQLDVKGVRAN